MRIITLEDHFTTLMAKELLPKPTPEQQHHRDEMNRRLGFDSDVELLDLGARRIAAMDAAGIDFQVVSMTAPGCQGYEAAQSASLARDANDRMHEAVKAHPDRLGGFAALPTADPALAAKELERAVTKLGLKGALINGHTRGSYLDDRKYWGIFECAQSLDVPIYLHPTRPTPAVSKALFGEFEELAGAAWGFSADTGAHYLRLVFAGIFDAFPRLKLILGHNGEGLPFVMERLNAHTVMDAERRGLKKSPLGYLREHLIVTNSGNFSVAAFMGMYLALGPDRIMFSVDWPYERNEEAMAFFHALPVGGADRAKIAHLNAERILGL
jgi:predicted TIM-barrel fold metal-dependent hydrolase